MDRSNMESGPQATQIAEAIARCQTSLVLLGPHGLGPWQEIEIECLQNRFISRDNEPGRIIIAYICGASPQRHPKPGLLSGWNHFVLSHPQDLRSQHADVDGAKIIASIGKYCGMSPTAVDARDGSQHPVPGWPAKAADYAWIVPRFDTPVVVSGRNREQVQNVLAGSSGVITIEGASRSGKSNFLAAIKQYAQSLGITTSYHDLKSWLSTEQFLDGLCIDLGLEVSGNESRATLVFKELKRLSKPLLICIDNYHLCRSGDEAIPAGAKPLLEELALLLEGTWLPRANLLPWVRFAIAGRIVPRSQGSWDTPQVEVEMVMSPAEWLEYLQSYPPTRDVTLDDVECTAAELLQQIDPCLLHFKSTAAANAKRNTNVPSVVSVADDTELYRRLQAAHNDRFEMALIFLDHHLPKQSKQLQDAFEIAALGHWFNASILARHFRVNESTAQAWIDQLSKLPFVEPFVERDGWNVHDATRTAFRRRMAQDQFERFSDLSRRLADCLTAIRIEEQVERLFHRLAAGIAEAPDELNAQWKSWHRAGRTAPLQMLGLALEELSGQPTLPAACRGRVLYCLASIRRTRWTLDRSLKLIEESRVAFDAQVDLAGRMDAFDLQGDLESTAGRNDAALRSYHAAFDLATQLIQQEPMRWEWQRELAVGHNNVGSILQAQGKLSEALREYAQSRDIRLRLTKHDPANTAWQRDLSVSHTNVGGVLFRLQRLDDALQSCQAARDLRQKCLIADSLRVDNYRELAVIDFWIASIHQEKRQWQAAHEAIVLAVTSIQEARRRSPETVQFREVEQVIMARMQQIEKQMRKS